MVVIKWCTECKRGELGWGLWDNLISEEGPIKLFLMPWMISSCYNLGITLKCGVWDKIFYDRQAPSADKNQYICFAHTRSRLTSDTSDVLIDITRVTSLFRASADAYFATCLATTQLPSLITHAFRWQPFLWLWNACVHMSVCSLCVRLNRFYPADFGR